MNDMGLKVEEILNSFEEYLFDDIPETGPIGGLGLNKEQAKSAILTLFKEMVPEEKAGENDNPVDEALDEGWNACRKSMLSRIEEMK